MAPEVRLPLWPSKYFEFEPFVRYHHVSQWHEEEDGDRDHHHRQAYEMGARVMTNLERVYTVNVWGAKRLKHRIWPTLSYRYRVPQDPDAFMPWYEPIDVEGKVNVVAFSLQNFLDARQENEKGAVRYRQWVTLDLVQAYDIDEARRDEKPGRDNEPFAPFFAEMIVRPYDEVDIRGSAQWDHYDEEVETADFSLELSVAREGGRRDIYSLDYLYENGGREFLNFWIDVYLANGLSVGGALRRNLRFSESISSSYWLEYREHCAGVRFTAHTGEDETSFLVTFQLRGLGDDRDW
jgi:LPS-assembly protein